MVTQTELGLRLAQFKNGIRLKRRMPFFVLLNAFTHFAPPLATPKSAVSAE
jgi:hypothetical protein